MARSAASLEALSPLAVLSRGYAIAQDKQGHVISNASELSNGDNVRVRLAKGSFLACVTETEDYDLDNGPQKQEG